MYKGIDIFNGHSLNYAIDGFSVDHITGTIKVSSEKQPGTYYVRIVGSLPSRNISKSIVVTIRINNPPYFEEKLRDLEVPLMGTVNYKLPAMKD